MADPQLIDPHTYPGRPWPLNPLAYKYTDLYLRRTYSRLQTVLYPDTIFFLGDLFDGGREWSTRTSRSPEKQYRKYGDDYWLNEYRRFGNIFFRHWGDGGLDPRPGQPGRKLISSLPGNHDLGFAKGVQEGVRNRFNAYFGEGNRIDIIANHTFVSIDSVSLSAVGMEYPEQVENLWRPTVDFLDSAAKQKKRLIQRELRRQQGLRPYPGFRHKHYEAGELPTAELPHSNDDVTEFPTILLSHVPLYRAPGTPCGPQRERWPPTPPPAGQPPLEEDHRNAISVSGGYQYQNVLHKEVTIDLANKIGDIQYAFSGDDHDYCEVLHRGYASGGGGIREITVKSTSWAMGVRHPGVVLVSLWNPVDKHGKPLNGNAHATMQTKLCLYPDQIGTFIKYGLLFGITLTALLVRAMGVKAGRIPPSTTPFTIPSTSSSASSTTSILPISEPDPQQDNTHSSNSSTSSTHAAAAAANIQIRSSQARTRSAMGNHSSTHPLVQYAGYYPPEVQDGNANNEDEDHPTNKEKKKVRIYDGANGLLGRASAAVGGGGGAAGLNTKRRRKGWDSFFYEMRCSLGWVLLCGGVWYVWLVWVDSA